MTTVASAFKIDAVLERKHHSMTADGLGIGELIFSITNDGDTINASEISMAIAFTGQTSKYPLPFPEGISMIKKGECVVFNSNPKSLTRNSGAVIVLMNISDGQEIIRVKVRDIP
ncbi:hypothetical protein [Methanoregula sp.]|uniref:hypothetical protein n=1 Tax=Methanoregula sp. TaxID=2052170 RepID=UPI0035660430